MICILIFIYYQSISFLIFLSCTKYLMYFLTNFVGSLYPLLSATLLASFLAIPCCTPVCFVMILKTGGSTSVLGMIGFVGPWATIFNLDVMDFFVLKWCSLFPRLLMLIGVYMLLMLLNEEASLNKLIADRYVCGVVWGFVF